MTGPTRLDFIRHGEPVGGRRYRGDQVDDPLCEAGWTQMWARIDAMPDPNWDRIITSPLRRCEAFARALAERRGCPLEREPALREIGFGHWEGLTHQAVRDERPAEYRAYRADPVGGRPPGAESLTAFAERVRDAMARLVARYPGQRLLVVSHAVVMRMALCQALGAPLEAVTRVTTDYAGWLRLTHDEDGWRLACLCNGEPGET